ncbi:MAG: DUF2520 domain-containing protein [Pseudomonadota bacterium]
MIPNIEIAVYGLGSAGRALVGTLCAQGLQVITLWNRDPDHARDAARELGMPVASGEPPRTRARLIFVAVRDQAVVEVARHLVATGCIPSGAVLAHLAGALAAEVLDVAAGRDWYVGALHPLRALRGISTTVQGSFCALDGEAPAMQLLEALCAHLGCPSARVAPEQRALYHAAAALAGNDVVALLDAALRALQIAGLAPAQARLAAVDLCRSALDNLGQRGPAEALTGALVRGDDQVIAAHLQALSALDANSVALHRIACRALLPLARARGLDVGSLQRMHALVDDRDGNT